MQDPAAYLADTVVIEILWNRYRTGKIKEGNNTEGAGDWSEKLHKSVLV